jgi:hypothetical protein
MACASHSEWDQVELTMSVTQVRTIVGGPGDKGPVMDDGPHRGEYKVDWPACWDGSRKCRGWFNARTDILVDKNVIDA